MILAIWIIVILTLFYQQASLSVWTIATALLLGLQSYFGYLSLGSDIVIWTLFIAAAVIFNFKPLRRELITRHLLNLYRRMMPRLSQTEREAIAAGTVGWEGELFSGNPDWDKLLSIPAPQLTEEEQAFLDGPVETLCQMVNDWEMTHHRADLSPEIWQFLKQEGFFGLIIPKQYGGKEFSALGHATIVAKVYPCSSMLASMITVPNSLGPAELLLHYGTEDQKNYYLPRLAKGEEIPCFALTGPEAGSDAGSIPDTGIVCRKQDVLGIRLNWDKRYITLAPVATVLGLAFKLYDPDHLLGEREEYGITCALIPVNTPGITIGRRHLPLNIPFQNGPTQGKDVFIPMDWIIGGTEMAGQGWRMLVQCLSVGRAISLPSSVLGAAKAIALETGAYAHIRRQFNMPIGQFEGIQEALARIAGNTYLMQAASLMTVNAINQGEKPAVASAILKYHATELGRQVVIDAMDIHGGKGICLGPRNYLGRLYQSAPIAITVEGANILTRNMIIFGQGVIRSHPYLLAEMEAAQNLVKFDEAIFAHAGFIMSNKVRTLLLGISAGRLAGSPQAADKLTRRYYQYLTRFSSAFALISDMAVMVLGSQLKRKERLSARLGDVLSALYCISAVLKYYEDQERPMEDFPLIEWTCHQYFFIIQERLHEILKNFPNKWIAWSLRICIFPLGRHFSLPNDPLDQKVAQLLLHPSLTRDRLRQNVYGAPIFLEQVFHQIVAAEKIDRHLQQALRERGIMTTNLAQRIAEGLDADVITRADAEQLLQAEAARKAAIAVDDFDPRELQTNYVS